MRAKSIRRLIVATTFSLMSVVIGVLGYMYFEGLNFVNAFYLAIITISTVGFGTLGELTQNGKLFTSFYIIFNLSVLAFGVSVITRYLFEGELRDVLSNYMSSREVKKLQNHVIICGYGSNGVVAAEEFNKDNIPYVVVDTDPNVAKKRHGEGSTINFIQGDATNEETLLYAGIKKAKAIIASVPDDSINVFITLTARELNPEIKIIARSVRQSSEHKLYRAGADNVVMPNAIGGHYMAAFVNKPQVIEFLDMINGVGEVKVELEEMSYMDFKPEFRGKSIIELNVRESCAVTFLVCKNSDNGYVFNPSSSTVLSKGDVYIVVGTPEAIEQFKVLYSIKK